MDHLLPSKEKASDHSALPRGRTEGMDSGSADNSMRNSILEESLGNVAEQMDFDAYAGWCNSPSSLTDQMFPSFALSPITLASTNFSPFDGLNFTHQYSSGISIVDGDIMGSSFISGDSQVPFATSCADGGYDLTETNNLEGDVRSCVIPRPPMESLAEKMLRALNLLKESSGGGILAQVWVPVKNGDRYILSTCEQPYLLDQTLSGYREVSRSFTFAAETKPGCFLGLPGRVFASKIPEWTSNVVYYNKSEYLRVQYAVDHEIRGSIALPVFQDDSDSLERSCCAVLELVTMTEKPNFDLEMENVCRALEVVNLRSAVPPRLYPQSLSRNQRAALAEITDVLRVVCYAHRLPLALTWIPCSYIDVPGDETIKLRARGCHISLNDSFNEKCVLCIEKNACYVNDKDMEGFVHACVEHYLEEGQGIAGKALQSSHPFFHANVKEYHISDYPLVQHARKYGLNAAVAIRLRSTYTGDNDYILELFLPVNMRASIEQQLLLNNLSSTMQRICKSLRTVSDDEWHGVENSKVKLHDTEVKKIPSMGKSFEPSGFNIVDPINQNIFESTTTRVEAGIPAEQQMIGSRKRMEKRSTAEKHVSLSVLQQYFSGSLKDAAKSIGVCPTTLKRICRQHGISRWPSRKINKVNRSLKKIQSVIDSVKEMEGGLKFDPGCMIQEVDSKNEPLIECDLVIQNTKSCMEIETTLVKMEKESQLYRNQVAGEYRPSLHPIIASSEVGLSRPTSLKLKLEGDTKMNREVDVVTYNQPTSSGSTASESGSMMNCSSSSSKSSGKSCQNHKIETSYEDSGSKLTVKATYKEDTIRFKFDPAVGYVQLYEQVAKRFKLQMGQFQLKYLDDEKEWVMLVSDSDLQECLEILDLVGTRNVKFLVRDTPSAIGSSGGSNCFLGGDG